MFFFFFFQAEDGIRDGHVTGVQTCALPISQGWWNWEIPSVPSLCRSHSILLTPLPFPNSTNPAHHERESAGRAVRSQREDRKSVGEGKSVERGGRRGSERRTRRGVW